MKLVFLSLLCALGPSTLADQNLKLDSIGLGKELLIDGRIQLPSGQKLNSHAPSKVEVFEKEGSEWVLAENVDLNQFFSLTELIAFQRSVKLRSEKSELMLKANLYHCPRTGRGLCVIDDYVGLVQRDKKKPNTKLRLALNGSSPRASRQQ
ncbi:MAG: hypothetical protein KF799_07310 [Bdellovibrionales bacterium]|nr:hypothetical protein [Bdellovibrionales bacterium]